MKRLTYHEISITVLACLMFLASCKQKPKKSEFGRYLELKELAIKDTVNIDSALLGFRFGMTEKEADTHFEELVKEGKLKIGKRSNYYYEIPYESLPEPLKCAFSLEYFNGKLFKITLSPLDDELSSIYSSTISYLTFSRALERRYGFPTVAYKLGKEELPTEVWFKNNIEISLSPGFVEPQAQYTDLKIEKIKEEQEAIEQSKKINENIQDL